MRDPHRYRTVGLWSLGLGALSLAWVWLGAGHGVGVRAALIFFGAMGVAFGGVLVLLQHQNVRAKQALARGEDIIAADGWRRKIGNDFSR